MNRNTYVKIAVTVLLVAVIFFGILIVNALDRLHQSNRLLLSKLDQLGRQPVVMAGVPAAPLQAGNIPAGAVGNRMFFDPQAQPGGRLIQAIQADTQNLNDLINNDQFAAVVQGIINSTLATRNYAKPEIFEPLMAESWTVSPDRLTYTIRLRKGILWHDFTDPVTGKEWKNREVTADDFKFYLDVIRNPDVNCAPLRVYYQDIAEMKVINPYEFVVRWQKPYFGSQAMTLSMRPLPRHLYNPDGKFDGKRFNDDHLRNRIAIGCGPYKLLRWEKDVRVIFTRFDNYFGNALGIRPPLAELAFELIKHPNTRYQALLAGQLDQLGLLPEQWIHRTEAPEFKDKYDKFTYPAQAYSFIGYNLRNPLFADRRVRQALTMLVDRERILREIYLGLGRIITGPFFPDSIYSDPALKPWPYDVERAKKLLAEAGWRDTDGDGILDKDGRKFTFAILQVSGHPIQQKMLPLIKESMALAGIDLKIQPLEWSVCLQRLEQRKFEAFTLGWTMPLDPDPYQVWHSSHMDQTNSSNNIGYKNPEVDKLIDQLRETFDLKERATICHRIARILHEDQPYTFLINPSSLVAISKRYRNVRVFPAVGIADELLWTPKNEQRSVPGL